MRSRVLTGVLLALLAYYVVRIGAQGVGLLGDSRGAFKGLGLGLVLLALFGVLIAAAEVRFARAASRLAREAGDVEVGSFDEEAARVEADVRDWRAWYRLALAYHHDGDTRRGRAAMRHAIALARLDRVEQPR